MTAGAKKGLPFHYYALHGIQTSALQIYNIPNKRSVYGIYQLRGVVVYGQLTVIHWDTIYTAFFRSIKDESKWFRASDTDVSRYFNQIAEYIYSIR